VNTDHGGIVPALAVVCSPAEPGPAVAAAYVDTLTTEPGRAGTRSAFIRAAQTLAPQTQPQWSWDGVARLRWDTLTANGAALLRSRLAAEVDANQTAPATANRVLSAVRGALRQAWAVGLLDRDSLERFTDRKAGLLKFIPNERPQPGRHIAEAELAQLFAHLAADTSPMARRDAAALSLWCIGLRLAESAGLNAEDFNTAAELLTVRGKGHKVRRVPLTNGTLSAVRDWLTVRGVSPGALFYSITNTGAVRAERITTTGLAFMLANRCAAAGVQRFTAHDLRRTFTGNAISGGVDLVTLGALLGHKSPATTAKYDRRPESVRRAAMGVVCIPYISPAA